MGLVKTDWMEAEERGWSGVDKVVCAGCVDDPALKRVVRGAARSGRCDYCGNRRKVAAVEALQEAVYAAVWTYYHEPTDAGVPWDSGFVIDPIDIEEVFYDLGFDGHPDLIADIVDADMGNGWVAAADGHWASAHDHEVMLGSWASFVEVIKHKTRFHFGSVGEVSTAGAQDVEPRHMLGVLGKRLRPYVRQVPEGTRVFRARMKDKGDIWSPCAEELGAPPFDKARAGRMNPAGIPYLYVAFDTKTALQEIGEPTAKTEATFMATFELTEPLLVIDLTRLPPPPSVFDLEKKDEREKLLFARGFVDAISKPVIKNGQEHVEYVPSQVVCEYLAQVFKPRGNATLGGLVFPSSVREGGRNLVVFPSERGLDQSFHGVEYRRARRVWSRR